MESELVEPAPFLTYTEIFEKHFPYYLSIGMTYDEYWNQDCLLTKYYREAEKLKNDRMNQELWLQGMYIYDALCCVAPVMHAMAKSGTKPLPYPERPYPLAEEDIEKRREEEERTNRKRARAVFETWASNLKLPEEKGVGWDG